MRRFFSITILQISILIFTLIVTAQRKPLLSWEQPDTTFIGGTLLSKDQTQLITSGISGSAIWYWDWTTGKPIKKIEIPSVGGLFALSPDEKWIVINSAPQQAGLYNLETKEQKYIFKWNKYDPLDSRSIDSLAFTPDGQKIVGIDGHGTCIVFDFLSGKELGTWTVDPYNLLIFPDGKTALTQSSDYAEASLFSLEDGKSLHFFNGYGSRVSPDYKYLYIIAGVGKNPYYADFQVWDLATLKLLNSKQYDFKLIGNKYEIFPSGKYFIGLNESNLKIKSSENSVIATDLTVDQVGNFDRVLITPDEKKLFSFVENRIYVWDISDLTSGIPDAPEHK